MTALILLPENVPIPSQTFFFDTSILPAEWSYTNGNQTATKVSGGIWRSALLDPAYTKSSGKWYIEFQNTANTTVFGCIVGQTTAGTTTTWLGTLASDWGYMSSTGTCPSANGRRANAGVTPAYGPPWCVIPPTKTVMIAADLDNGDIWYGVDGVWAVGSDPSTLTNPAFTGVTTTNTRFGVSCFGATESFTIPATLGYPVPTGFSVLV